MICNFPVDADENDKSLEMSWTNYIQGAEEVQYRLNDWMGEYMESVIQFQKHLKIIRNVY